MSSHRTGRGEVLAKVVFALIILVIFIVAIGIRLAITGGDVGCAFAQDPRALRRCEGRPMTGPQRFRKKPVEIEAQQYTNAQSANEIIRRILDAGGSASLHCVDPDQLGHGGHTIRIRTLEGDMHAAVDDWVIRGVQGEFYPCKPDIFAATYEGVT